MRINGEIIGLVWNENSSVYFVSCIFHCLARALCFCFQCSLAWWWRGENVRVHFIGSNNKGLCSFLQATSRNVGPGGLNHGEKSDFIYVGHSLTCELFYWQLPGRIHKTFMWFMVVWQSLFLSSSLRVSTSFCNIRLGLLPPSCGISDNRRSGF